MFETKRFRLHQTSNEEITMTIKLNPVAVAAVLATLATAGITVPAFAQTRATPSRDTCYSLSIERGAAPGRGAGNAETQHNAFVDQCLAGKIPLTVEESPRARSLGGTFASASVPKHTSRRRAATRSRTELGTQH
jgi:hypothetical protein